MGTFPAVESADPPRRAVVAVSSNKGGVGKTTLAANLAVYARALDEELPILVVGLDDQSVLDRMFALGALEPGAPNLKHAWAERDLERAVRLGQYGVHWVPAPPDAVRLKARAEDPGILRRMLERLGWPGLVVIDTKSDLEALTRNALHAADRVLVPVSDRAALEEAAKGFAYLERSNLGTDRARVVFTLVDSRTRAGEAGTLLEVLRGEVARRGWRAYGTFLSRSPRVETLNSLDARPRTILHHGQGTRVHRQMGVLAREILGDAGLLPGAIAPSRARPVRPVTPDLLTDLKAALLRGLRGR
jgi:chromosome partitioning protein